MLFEGWWLAFGFSGLPITVGVIIWMVIRDRERKKKAEKDRLRRTLEEAERDGSDSARELRELLKKKE
ncbi:MAG: hypothetical protein ACLFUS_00420 [Candidatus Sumerlaeia bacterium]